MSHKYRQRQDRKEGKKLSRRRGGYNKPYRRGLIVFVIIILLAIGSGYLITKYIIGSFYGDELSADGQGSNDQDFSGSSIIIGQQDITEENPEDDKNENPSVATNVNNNLENTQHTITLYCIQYGSFSAKEGAEQVVQELRASNIDTMVFITDGSYKVLGTPYTREEDAREALANMKAIVGEDIFITTVEAMMR